MSQKELWNNIAPEWAEFKKKPSELSIDFLKKQKGKILDLGSGTGRHLIELKSGEMYLVDFSEEMIKLAKKKAREEKIKAKFFISDLEKLPFKENFFDAGISISAIHCIPKNNHEQIIKEIYRVLKPKAGILIGVWNKNSKRFKNLKTKEKYIGWRDKGKRYYYLFEEEEIHNLFKKNGFKIIQTQNSELMMRFVAQKI